VTALRLALVAGEASGDHLGGRLMKALKAERDGALEPIGVGGEAMAAEGLKSLFPLADIHVMGATAVLRRLPTIFRRIRQSAEAVIAAKPDGLVIIDAPDFTHRVARRVRAALPDLPIVDYVSPTVWAWRPGRARAMRDYVDCVLALLPFEPAAHRRLGGPRCVYVGHPLVERLAELRPNADELREREAKPPLIAVLPGSRPAEVSRLMPPFGAALALLAERAGPLRLALPTLPHVESDARALAASWPIRPRVETSEAAKLAIFRASRAALAASGTATLELALAGVPLVGAYRVSALEWPLRFLVKAPSVLLPNLVLGEKSVPELLQDECTPERLAAALAPLVEDSGERRAAQAALARLDGLMRLSDGASPSAKAAQIVLETIAAKRSGAGASAFDA